MWLRGAILELRKRRALRLLSYGPLRDYLSAPFPSPRRRTDGVNFVAVDIETTGLDPAKDEIIAVGLVPMHGDRIELAGAHRWLIAPSGPIPERSAVIHQITDDRAAGGRSIDAVLPELLAELAGKVLVAHHACLETRFLDNACRRLYRGPFLAPVVDTERLERLWRERRNLPAAPGELRLGALRESHNLPRYRAHDALSDALGAAELFLAQLALRGGAAKVSLGEVLC